MSGVERWDAPCSRFSNYQWSGKWLLTCTWLAWDIWVSTEQINGMLLAQQLLFQAPCKLPGYVLWLQPAGIITVLGAAVANGCCASANKGERSIKGECQVSHVSWAPSLRSRAWDLSWDSRRCPLFCCRRCSSGCKWLLTMWQVFATFVSDGSRGPKCH